MALSAARDFSLHQPSIGYDQSVAATGHEHGTAAAASQNVPRVSLCGESIISRSSSKSQCLIFVIIVAVTPCASLLALVTPMLTPPLLATPLLTAPALLTFQICVGASIASPIFGFNERVSGTLLPLAGISLVLSVAIAMTGNFVGGASNDSSTVDAPASPAPVKAS